MTLDYAVQHHAPYGRLTQCAGQIAVAASCFAQAILAARGEWVTNEKLLLARAGLSGIDAVLEGMTRDPGSLRAAIERVGELCRAELEKVWEP